MATHALVYYGYFGTSFHRLVPKQKHYWRKGGGRGRVMLPTKAFDGIQFGFMEQAPKNFLFVQVDDLPLAAPVLFVGGRHGPAGPGPAWSKLDDDVAANILVDVIVANPGCRDILGGKLRTLTL